MYSIFFVRATILVTKFTVLNRLFRKKIIKKKFLIIGHPRSGTGYTCKQMQEFGFDIGHEIMKKDGISSWWLVAEDYQPWLNQSLRRKDFNFEKIIVSIRDPLKMVSSTLYTENGSLFFRKKHLPELKNCSNEVERAVNSVIGWYDLVIGLNSDFIFRIEEPESLVTWLEKEGYSINKDKILRKRVNSRIHPNLTIDDIRKNTSKKVFNDFIKFSKKFEYEY